MYKSHMPHPEILNYNLFGESRDLPDVVRRADIVVAAVGRAQMVPGVPDTMPRREAAFLAALADASPDFQTEAGYTPDRFGEEMLTLASKWVAHRFGCLSLTLEMPFKDNRLLPDGQHVWSGVRSKRLGAAMLGRKTGLELPNLTLLNRHRAAFDYHTQIRNSVFECSDS